MDPWQHNDNLTGGDGARPVVSLSAIPVGPSLAVLRIAGLTTNRPPLGRPVRIKINRRIGVSGRAPVHQNSQAPSSH